MLFVKIMLNAILLFLAILGVISLIILNMLQEALSYQETLFTFLENKYNEKFVINGINTTFIPKKIIFKCTPINDPNNKFEVKVKNQNGTLNFEDNYQKKNEE